MTDKNNHILYLYEYQDIPEEIVKWKDDEDITSISVESIKDKIPNLLCIGTGTYKTSADQSRKWGGNQLCNRCASFCRTGRKGIIIPTK